MSKVPYTSILAKDAFLQSLAMDNNIYGKSNKQYIDELFMINLLKGDLTNSSSTTLPPDPIYNSQPANFTTKKVDSTIPYLDYTNPNEGYYEFPPSVSNNSQRNNLQRNVSTISLDQHHLKKSSSAKNIPQDEREPFREFEDLKEHCKRLEDSNKKLKDKLTTQDLWASGQRKYVKDLVQQLKNKDGTVEELQTELKKKQKTIDSLRAAKPTLHDTSQEAHSAGREKKKDDSNQQIHTLQEQLKEMRKKEQRTKDIINTYKEQITKRDTTITELETKNAELVKSNNQLTKQLKKLEAENEILSNNLNKITQQYSEIKIICEQLCNQTTNALQTQKEINGKIVSLSI